MAEPLKQFTILFLTRGDQVLLAMKKRGFGAGKWNGVGGKVEPKETVEQAAVRECQEEIGVVPTKLYKAADIIYTEPMHGETVSIHVQAFVASAWEGKPTESEEMAPQWFSINELPYDQMWSDDPYWLESVLKGKLLRCRFTLDDDGRTVEHEVQEVEKL